MNRRPFHLLFGGLVIIVAALVLNFVQVQASTEKALTQAQVSQKLVAARDLKVSLERGMGLGKPLSLYSGADRLFDGLQARYEGLEFLAFTGRSLEVYASKGPNAFASLAPQDLPAFAATDKGGEFKTVTVGSLVLVALPLYFNADLKGLAWVGFSRAPIQSQVQVEAEAGLQALGWALVLALGAFAFLFFLLVRGRSSNAPAVAEKKKFYLPLVARISLAIVAVLLVSILGSAWASSSRLTPLLVHAYQRNVEVLVGSQAGELQRLLEWNVAPERWKGAEGLLAAQIQHTPEAEVLALTDNVGTVLYQADHQSVYPRPGVINPPDALSPGPSWVRQSLVDKQGVAQAWLWSRVSPAFLDAVLLDRLLDALTVTLVSLIFSIELLLALGLLAKLRPRGSPFVPETETGVKTVRFTAFLFFMAELLPLPFLPLFISDLYTHAPLVLGGLSADAVKGLPFSAHLLGVMVFVPVVGALTRRFSLQTLFLASGALLLAGNVLAAFSGNLAVLIGFRFLSGLGYGGALAASAALVVQTVPKENRTSGFAAWGAGFAAASICAVILGGILVSHVGYRNGLLVAAALSLALGLFVALFHPRQKPQVEAAVTKTKWSDLLAPFRDRSALFTLIFASLPVQLAFFGLFQYTLPLAMNQSGLSEANIGRILTIYGLISLASPLVARYADRHRNEKRLIVVGNVVTGLALMVFFVTSGVWPMIFVVAAIGVGGLLFDTVISSHLSLTKASQAHGEAPFLSIFLTWEKLFTVFVPVLVGTLMTSLGYLPSAAVLGVVILVGALVFHFFGTARTKS